jgi:hypothetical protein
VQTDLAPCYGVPGIEEDKNMKKFDAGEFRSTNGMIYGDLQRGDVLIEVLDSDVECATVKGAGSGEVELCQDDDCWAASSYWKIERYDLLFRPAKDTRIALSPKSTPEVRTGDLLVFRTDLEPSSEVVAAIGSDRQVVIRSLRNSTTATTTADQLFALGYRWIERRSVDQTLERRILGVRQLLACCFGREIELNVTFGSESVVVRCGDFAVGKGPTLDSALVHLEAQLSDRIKRAATMLAQP